MKTAVIGGGLSGLAAAYNIGKKAAEKGIKTEVRVFEREGRAGGTISSRAEAGYLLEGGPNGFLDSRPSTLELAGRLGIAPKLVRAGGPAARRYIYTGKKLYAVPGGPREFIMSGLVSLPGKARIALEAFVPPKKDGEDESVASFVRRRLGPEALEKLVGPMVSGIYAGDPEKLGMLGAFPRMRQLESEYGSLILAMAGIGRGGSPPGTLTSFEDGMQFLTDTLEDGLAGGVLKNSAVRSVRKKESGWEVLCGGGAWTADAVVFAVPAYDLKEIFPAPGGAGGPAVSGLCGKINYAPVNLVYAGFESGKTGGKADGFGFLSTRGSGSGILGVIFASNIFGKRAPAGHALFTVLSGGALSPDSAGLGDAGPAGTASGALAGALGMKGRPDFIRVLKHGAAIPQYPVGFPGIKKNLEEALAGEKGLFLAGNAFYGVGINDCTKRAAEVGTQVAEYLAGKAAA